MASDRKALAAAEIELLEEQLFFARVQFDEVSRAAPSHKSATLASRLADLQTRILVLEGILTRAQQNFPGPVAWSEETLERVVRWSYPWIDPTIPTPAVLLADADSHYVGANDAAVALLGYSVDELRERSVADVVAWQREWTKAEWARFRADGEWTGPVELRRKDGARIRVRAHSKIIRSRHGAVYVSVLTGAESVSTPNES